MRIGFARIVTLRNADGLNAIAERRTGHIAQIAQKLFKPAFQSQPVPQDQIGILRVQNIAWRRLIAMDFGPRLGDALHLSRIARDVSRHIGNHGKGRDGFELTLGPGSGRKRQGQHSA